ncbi:transcriptional regulator Cro [Salmonella enterica subsp. salamae]|nr:transcriptional regulator Cro [Salmonella enterica subsp. salamae]
MNKSTAVDFFGSQRAIAAALDISEQAVSRWGNLIPKGSALELEKLTNGALRCELEVYRLHPRKNKRTGV